MKNLCLLVSGVLLLTFPAFTQNKQECNSQNGTCTSKTKQPVVTKGYYAIGDNIKQLAKYNAVSVCCNANNAIVNAAYQQPKITKGYYAIGTNKDSMLEKQPGYEEAAQPAKVKKGFYSIGDNHKKLKAKNNRDNCCLNCSCS